MNIKFSEINIVKLNIYQRWDFITWEISKPNAMMNLTMYG